MRGGRHLPSAMAYQDPTLGPPSRGGTLRRLGVYLFGIAIGLMILGAIQMAKNSATQGAPTQPAAGSPANPSPPTGSAPSSPADANGP